MKFSKILLEARSDEFRVAFTQKFGNELVDKIVAGVMPKYLNWVGKLDPIEIKDELHNLFSSLNRFDAISSNLTKTDINDYKNLNELISAIRDYDNKTRRNFREVPGGVVVYEDDRFFVVNPLTKDSSCYYGKGTKWCTAASTDDQFTKYNEDGKLFYILDKKLKTDDPFYKVALLKKFVGDESWWDARDNSFNKGWIFGSNELVNILQKISGYIQTQFEEQVKIWNDKESAKKEKQRLDRLREVRRLRGLEEEANERRIANEWDLDTTQDSVGIKAHALLKWLEDNNDITILSSADIAKLSDLRFQLEELEDRQSNGEDVQDEIDDVESEISELEEGVDVYNIVPTGGYYDMTEFEVINAGLEGRRYAVGDADEMDSSAVRYVEGLIDDIGIDGFNRGFAMDYIDEDAIRNYAEDIYSDDVSSNPEVYFDESERELSDKQENDIQLLENKIVILRKQIEKFNELIDETEDEEEIENLEYKISEYEELITEHEDEIEYIKDSPNGEYPQDLIDEKVEEMVGNATDDPKSFISEQGLNWDEFIDKDEFIRGVIDTDGYGTVNGYDGNMDEVDVKGETYYVGRID